MRQIYTDDAAMFLTIANERRPEEERITVPEDLTDLSFEIVVPAFITSELKRAFLIGFLMSMGMVMLPPSMISLPFKIMMFVLVDGWGLLLGNLARSFH